jgi:hypothetical protein
MERVDMDGDGIEDLFCGNDSMNTVLAQSDFGLELWEMKI